MRNTFLAYELFNIIYIMRTLIWTSMEGKKHILDRSLLWLNDAAQYR